MLKRKNSDPEEPNFKRPAVEITHHEEEASEVSASTAEDNSASISADPQPAPKNNENDPPSESKPTSRLNEEVDASSTVHLRILVNPKEAVVIIGQRGNTIAKIRESSGVELKVSDHALGIKDRVVNIKGSCEHVSKATALITRCLNDEPFEQVSSPDAKVYTLKVLIPQGLMGAMIGKGGSRFRDIEEASAAKLKSREQLMPYSTDKVLQVQGVADAIHIAVYYVCTTCVAHQEYLRNNRPVFYNPLYALKQQRRQRQNYYGDSPMLPQGGFGGQYAQGPPPPSYGLDQRGGPPPPSGYYGHPMQNLQPYGARYTAPRPYVSNPPQMGGGAGPGGPAGALSRPQAMNIVNPSLRNAQVVAQNAERGKELKQDVRIPNNFVGSVIGKCGATISHLRQFSRSNIKVNDPIPNSNERVITVIGLPEANEMAIGLINNVIENEKLKNRPRYNRPASDGSFNGGAGNSNSAAISNGDTVGGAPDGGADGAEGGANEPVQNAS